jgi:hypothetical protein
MLLGSAAVSAQEIEPRTYANAPAGVNFLGVVYAFSTGNIVMDAALPIEGLDADIHTLVGRFTRTFGLLGRSSKFKVALPYSLGDWKGEFESEFAGRSIDGFADSRFVLEVNFLGAPALDRAEFQDYKQKWIAGASMRVLAPTGQYDSSKLINLGSNRWTFKPEIGFSRAYEKWSYEFAGSVWLFTDNDDFLDGNSLDQDPLWVLKTHAIWSRKPGQWISFGVGFGDGGRTSVNGVSRQTIQQNWRFAVTFAWALSPKQGIHFRLGSSVKKKAGSDFDVAGAGYQYAWGGR